MAMSIAELAREESKISIAGKKGKRVADMLAARVKTHASNFKKLKVKLGTTVDRARNIIGQAIADNTITPLEEAAIEEILSEVKRIDSESDSLRDTVKASLKLAKVTVNEMKPRVKKLRKAVESDPSARKSLDQALAKLSQLEDGEREMKKLFDSLDVLDKKLEHAKKAIKDILRSPLADYVKFWAIFHAVDFAIAGVLLLLLGPGPAIFWAAWGAIFLVINIVAGAIAALSGAFRKNRTVTSIF